MKLTEIQVKGFRTLTDVTVPMRDLAVIIGANGAGMTSLLEIFVFLRRAAHDTLPEIIQTFGGINSILSKVRDVSPVLDIELTGATDEKPTYTLHLSQESSGGYRIEHETYTRNAPETSTRDKKELRTSNIKNSHLAIAQSRLPFVVELRDLLRQVKFVTPISVQRGTPIRLPQTLIPGTDPGLQGESLFSALYNLSISHTEIYTRIINILQVAFPSFESMRLIPVGGGQVTLAWRMEGLSTDLYPLELSEGTLRFLWLVTLLLNPRTFTIASPR